MGRKVRDGAVVGGGREGSVSSRGFRLGESVGCVDARGRDGSCYCWAGSGGRTRGETEVG